MYGIKIEKENLIEPFSISNAVTVEEFRLAREINDKFAIDYLLKRFLSKETRIIHKNYRSAFENISFNELLAEITNFICEQGSWFNSTKYQSLEDIQKLFLQPNRERMPTTLVVEMLRLAYESGNGEILNYFSQYYYNYLEEMVDPEKLLSVDLAIELIKLAREKGDRGVLNYFLRYLDRRLEERNQVPSRLIIEVIKFAYEVSDLKTLNEFLEEYVPAIIKVRGIPSELLIELLKIIDENNNLVLLKELKIYCGKVIAGNKYIPHELASAMIKFARKFGDKETLDYFAQVYLKDILRVQNSVPIDLAIELVELMQESHAYDQASIENFYQKNISTSGCFLNVLLIDTLFDLRRLAQTFHDDDMLGNIKRVLDTVAGISKP